MNKPTLSRPHFVRFAAIITGVVVVLIAGAYLAASQLNPIPALVQNVRQDTVIETFPDVDNISLSDTQQKIVALLKQEYAAQPAGTKYADGVEESWCADFVSWIMRESGTPLENPNSGSWRIPGVYTLEEYYRSVGRFKEPGYQPQLGDVVMYNNPSPFGQHTNIVIANNNGEVTTVGGNEYGKIHIQVHNDANDAGLVGYGILQ